MSAHLGKAETIGQEFNYTMSHDPTLLKRSAFSQLVKKACTAFGSLMAAMHIYRPLLKVPRIAFTALSMCKIQRACRKWDDGGFRVCGRRAGKRRTRIRRKVSGAMAS